MRLALLVLPLLAAACANCPCDCDCPCAPSKPAGTSSAKAPEAGWQPLFDGKTLGSWKSTEFGGEGKVEVKDGRLVIHEGTALSGVTWTGAALPKMDYEIEAEAMKLDGSDIMFGLCFPVGEEHCSFVAGGWGGQIVGLSSVDGMMADGNDSTRVVEFKPERWYAFRLRVTKDKIEAWLDGKELFALETKEKKISLHPMMELAKPLGLATYMTRSALRNIRLRKLP